MKSKLNIAGLLAAAIVLGGCDPFWGGGWMWSPFDSTQKINLAFHASCEMGHADELMYGEDNDPNELDAIVTLKLTLHDRGFPREDVFEQQKNNKKHMAITTVNDKALRFATVDTECEDVSMDLMAFGMYCPQGAKLNAAAPGDGDGCGMAMVAVQDQGDVGPSVDDTVYVQLMGGHYDGYELGSCATGLPVGLPLEGGEITYGFGDLSGLSLN